MDSTKICLKCGNENDSDSKFCQKCGNKLNAASSDMNDAMEKKNTEKNLQFYIPIKPVTYVTIGILALTNLFLVINIHNNVAFLIMIPAMMLFTAFLVYNLSDKSISNSILIGFLAITPFLIIYAFNDLDENFISSALISSLIFGIFGIIGGLIGLYFKRRRLSINGIEYSKKPLQIEKYKSNRNNAMIFTVALLICIMVLGIFTASPVVWMKQTGDINGLIYVLQFGNTEEQLNVMKAPSGMDELESDFSSSGIKKSPYSDEILSILVEKVKYNSDYRIRMKAISTIADLWNGDENIAKTLETVKNSDPDQLVRLSAQGAIYAIEADRIMMRPMS